MSFKWFFHGEIKEKITRGTGVSFMIRSWVKSTVLIIETSKNQQLFGTVRVGNAKPNTCRTTVSKMINPWIKIYQFPQAPLK